MIKNIFSVLALGAVLSACAPAVPDSASGVGFEDSFARQQAQRDRLLAGSVPPPVTVTSGPLGGVNDGSAAATAAETQRVLAATNPNGLRDGSVTASGRQTVLASPGNPAPPVVNSAGISQENNFDAVSAQRGIQGDADRLAAARAQYEVIQPEALPARQDVGPNIVAYALSSNHGVGTNVYRRSGSKNQARFQRACAAYSSPDQAQIAFLSRGGPERDRLGVDPDGDGYACAWDPAPFRSATAGAQPAPVRQPASSPVPLPTSDTPIVISNEG